MERCTAACLRAENKFKMIINQKSVQFIFKPALSGRIRAVAQTHEGSGTTRHQQKSQTGMHDQRGAPMGEERPTTLNRRWPGYRRCAREGRETLAAGAGGGTDGQRGGQLSDTHRQETPATAFRHEDFTQYITDDHFADQLTVEPDPEPRIPLLEDDVQQVLKAQMESWKMRRKKPSAYSGATISKRRARLCSR